MIANAEPPLQPIPADKVMPLSEDVAGPRIHDMVRELLAGVAGRVDIEPTSYETGVWAGVIAVVMLIDSRWDA